MKTISYFLFMVFILSVCSGLYGLSLLRKLRRSYQEQKDTEIRYRSIVSQASDSIILADLDTLHILEANSGAEKLLGFSIEEFRGLTIKDIINEDPLRLDWELNRVQDEKICFFGEAGLRKNDGGLISAELSANIIPYGNSRAMCMIIRDLTTFKEYESKLLHMANHDPLTGLPNRKLFLDRLNYSLSQKDRTKSGLAVMFIDLDYFKVINDTLGHPAGDLLLKEMSMCLYTCVRRSDTVARMGGDEFTILIENLNKSDDAVTVAGKILTTLEKPFNLGGQEVFITASIGITFFPEDGTSAEELLKNADTAMYSAKETGRNKFRMFSRDLNEKALNRLAIETGLRYAIDKKELILHYQPKFTLDTGLLTGFEALIRWDHPEWGLVPPNRFIPLAEETGLIIPVGDWVLRTACTQCKTWMDMGMTPVKMAVNVSVRQFNQPGFARKVHDILIETGFNPLLLELEITESHIMSNPEEVIRIIGQLKELGISIAIDDFGTGYSSLMQIKRIPLNVLKIDKNFIKGINREINDEVIISTIISMGHSMGLDVIAEGVETEEQKTFLSAHNCDQVQGFLLGKPKPPHELTPIIFQDKRNSS